MFSSCEALLLDERARKNAKMAPFNSNFGGREGTSFFCFAKKLPQGVASKSPELVLDFYSAPTAFEPLRPEGHKILSLVRPLRPVFY